MNEQRYRWWLRAYPPAWRREHGDALLAVLLEAAADRGGRGPTAGEAVDLVRHGLVWRLRLAAPASTLRAVAWVAVVVGCAVSLIGTFSGVVAALVTVPGLDGRMAVEAPWEVPGLLPQLLWIIAGLAVLLGRATAARRLLLATLPLVALQLAALLAVPALQEHRALYPGWIVLWLVPASMLAGAARLEARLGARLRAAAAVLVLTGWALAAEWRTPQTGAQPPELWGYQAWVLPVTRVLLDPLPWLVLLAGLALLVRHRWRHSSAG